MSSGFVSDATAKSDMGRSWLRQGLPVTAKAPPLPIVVDTREQVPWEFDPSRCTVTRGTLQAGDYSVVGLEGVVAIERKSLDDYVQTIIHQRDRFRRELERLQGYKLAAVVVEATWQDVIDHAYQSLAHPNAIFGMTCCLIVDHGIPIYLSGERAIAQRFAERLLRRYVENLAAPKDAAE